jgi:hypothetical protein
MTEPDLNELLDAVNQPAIRDLIGPIELGPQDDVQALAPYIDRVIEAVLGPVWAFVTDHSEIRDFPVGEDDLPRLRETLGVAVALDDRVVEVAARMKAAGA